MVLYLFNPEHDYALAHHDPHFMAPASAIRFAHDCALFWQHLVDEEGYIFLPYREGAQFYDLQTRTYTEKPVRIDRIEPWGWDKLMQYQLKDLLTEFRIRSEEQVENTHALAHRSISIEGMEYLREQCGHLPLPPAAELLLSETEVARYIAAHQEVILKSPYSGNGRGLLYAHQGVYSNTLRRQTTGVLRRQGALLGEPLYQHIQDFALEFHCYRQQTLFVGYSLFMTKHYGYSGNLLCSDAHIRQMLSQWISLNDLDRLQEALTQFIQLRLAPHYEGPLGVDMLIYKEGETFRINPMLEINVRMTMGMVAHRLYATKLHTESIGNLLLLYRPQQGDIVAYLAQQMPMQCENGRWRQGTLALHPVNEQSQYALVVHATPPQKKKALTK